MNVRVLFVLAALVLVGAGVVAAVRLAGDDGPSGDVAAEGSPNPEVTPTIQPCDLVSAEEVAEVFPGTYTPIPMDSGTTRFCTFEDATVPEQTVFVQVGVLGGDIETTFASALGGAEEVEGVGDRAAYRAPVLYVRRGDDVLTFSAPQSQTEDQLAALVALAERALDAG